MGHPVQGSAKEPFPGCENVAGKLRQNWLATAGKKISKPGNGSLADPCTAVTAEVNMYSFWHILPYPLLFQMRYASLLSFRRSLIMVLKLGGGQGNSAQNSNQNNSTVRPACKVRDFDHEEGLLAFDHITRASLLSIWLIGTWLN